MQDVPTCVVPLTLHSYGNRTFAAAGPRLWRSLPVQLCNPDITYRLLRPPLTDTFFGKHEHGMTFDVRRRRKTLTYLLNM